MFVNAHTDVYLRGLAGPDAIAAIVVATPLPLNVLAGPGLPGAAALRELGVRRLSAGSGVAEAACAAARAKASAFLAEGDSDALCAGGGNYATINALMPQN